MRSLKELEKSMKNTRKCLELLKIITEILLEKFRKIKI